MNMHESVVEVLEGHFYFFAFADARHPIVTVAMDAEIADLVVGGQDEDKEEILGKEPWKILMAADT